MYIKNIVILFIAFSISYTACAQCATEVLKYAAEINEKDARKHLTILASDEFEGRDTGKPGGEKAANYIASEFKKLGLIAPVNGTYYQAVDLVESKFEVKHFSIEGVEYKNGSEFFMTGSGDERTINADEIVFIGYGISSPKYDDFEGVNINGKVVMLINEGEPVNKNQVSYITGNSKLSDWSNQRNKKIQAVLSKKPKLVLATSESVANTLKEYSEHSFNQARMTLRDNFRAPSQSSAVVHITTNLADRILQKSGTSLQKLKEQINSTGKPATRSLKNRISTTFGTSVKAVESSNVLGYLEGTDLKDELIVISAHYDHVGVQDGEIYNGADDDGSGVTGVLEMARAFSKSKKEGNGPRRSILFMMVTGEEKGLLGSDYYTRYPIYPLENTVSNLNIDMIGRVDPAHETNPDYIYLIGSDKLSSDLHKISEEANAKYTKLELDYKFNHPNDPERIYYRSDHYNFAKNGIPVIFYFNGVHEDYHKPSDTVDKINFELLVKRTKLVFHTAWEIANRDERLVVDSNKK